MENLLNVKDEIDEQVSKIKSIVSCLLSTRESELELSRDQIYNVVGVVDGLTDDLIQMCKQLDEDIKSDVDI